MKASFSRFWAGWRELAGYFADFQSRWLLTVFYFTLALPFGILASLFMDALHVHRAAETSGWINRIKQIDDIQTSQRLF